jgi:hypothetical protein
MPPNELLPLSRPHLFKFLELPKIAPLAGDQDFNNYPVGDISDSNHNSITHLSLLLPDPSHTEGHH